MNNDILRHHQSGKQVSGFTLVEVIVASAIFGIIMLAGLAFFSYGMKPAARANEITYALMLAQDAIENARQNFVKKHDFQSIPIGTTESAVSNDPDSGVHFTRTLGPHVNTTGFAGTMITYRVTVTWKPGNDPDANDRTIMLTTILAHPIYYH